MKTLTLDSAPSLTTKPLHSAESIEPLLWAVHYAESWFLQNNLTGIIHRHSTCPIYKHKHKTNASQWKQKPESSSAKKPMVGSKIERKLQSPPQATTDLAPLPLEFPKSSGCQSIPEAPGVDYHRPILESRAILRPAQSVKGLQRVVDS